MEMMLDGKRREPPGKGTCGTCKRFKPAVIHTFKGVPLTMWYGKCILCPVDRLETDTCPHWIEKHTQEQN